MVGKTTRGVFMDAEQLKKMEASEAVWLAVHLSGRRRRRHGPMPDDFGRD